VKKFLTTAAIALLMTTAAHAASKSNGITTYNLHQGKYWSTFATINDNKNADSPYQCAIQTEGSTTSKFYIKWTPTYGLRVQMWKKSWQIAEDTIIPFTIDLFDDRKPDDAKTLTVNGGWAVPAGNYGTSVFGTIHEDHTDAFMTKFREADRLVVNFPDGDEPSWNMKGEGTRKAAEEFAQCVAFMRKTLGDTANATQPTKPKTSPSKPQDTTSPTKGSAKKDNGSI
jgi:hypothetical protein